MTIIKTRLEGALNRMLCRWDGLLHRLGGLLWLVVWGGTIDTFIVFLPTTSYEFEKVLVWLGSSILTSVGLGWLGERS